MPKHDPEKQSARRYEREEPVSLAPLSFKEALVALMRVKPEGAEKASENDEEVEVGGEGEPDSEGGK